MLARDKDRVKGGLFQIVQVAPLGTTRPGYLTNLGDLHPHQQQHLLHHTLKYT